MRIPNKVLSWLIISYVLIIMVLSVADVNSNKQVNLSSTWVLSIRSDYLLHALLFVPWMVLVRWRWKEKKGAWFFMKALGAGLLLAVISEGVQYWLPYRAFNLVDLGANWVGVVLGGIVSWMMMR
jgi:glycopeptide antibiotics resistance protein